MLERHVRRAEGANSAITKRSAGVSLLLERFRELMLREYSRDEESDRLVRQEDTSRLVKLGIHPDSLAGRLRLVLTIGCYGDFRFTRDILSTSLTPERLELAIEALMDLGAVCDCQVFRAVGQLPRGVLWHHPA